jgi:hypothetical protein
VTGSAFERVSIGFHAITGLDIFVVHFSTSSWSYATDRVQEYCRAGTPVFAGNSKYLWQISAESGADGAFRKEWSLLFPVNP